MGDRHRQYVAKITSSETKFNIKIPSYLYKNSYCGDKAIVWSSYLCIGIYFVELEPCTPTQSSSSDCIFVIIYVESYRIDIAR